MVLGTWEANYVERLHSMKRYERKRIHRITLFEVSESDGTVPRKP